MKELGVVEYCAKLKEEGKIRYYGFSFHDDYEVFDEILHYRDWDFCQIQYNYMDTQEQAGDKGYALAESLGVPLVIMEPLSGSLPTSPKTSTTDSIRWIPTEALLPMRFAGWEAIPM